jgi:hypothetical protein
MVFVIIQMIPTQLPINSQKKTHQKQIDIWPNLI